MIAPRAGGSAADCPADAWNRLARRGFHRHGWFRAAEAAGWAPDHVTVPGTGDAPRAILPTYRQARVLHGDLHERWLGPVAGPADALGCRLRPTLAAVVPLAQTSQPLGDWDDLSDATVDGVLELLLATARERGAKAAVLPYLGPDDGALLRAGRRLGFAGAFVGSTAVLDVVWSDFEDYLASRSKSVRRTIRLERNEVAGAGVRVSQEESFGELAPRWEELWRADHRARTAREAPLPAAFFRELAERPDGVSLQVTRRGDRVVAASVWAEANGVVDAGFAAFEDERPGALYFHELVYAPLEMAMARGFRRLDLGPSALVPKLLRGAKLRPRTTLVRGTTPAVHGVLARLARAVSARNRRKEERQLAAIGRRGG